VVLAVRVEGEDVVGPADAQGGGANGLQQGQGGGGDQAELEGGVFHGSPEFGKG
jgi:hypothetical protein